MTPRKAALIGAFGSWVVRALMWTLRFQIDDQAGVTRNKDPRMIWLFWHNRLFIIPYFGQRFLPHRPGAALTSASKDGEILAAFLRRFNVTPARGSSSRRGAAGLIELIRHIRSGLDAAITPDGPRGPRYQVNPGVIKLAQTTGARIMPVRIHYSRYWQLKSWDAFMIPKPFARVDITLLPLEEIPATADETTFEQERSRIESILREGQAET